MSFTSMNTMKRSGSIRMGVSTYQKTSIKGEIEINTHESKEEVFLALDQLFEWMKLEIVKDFDKSILLRPIGATQHVLLSSLLVDTGETFEVLDYSGVNEPPRNKLKCFSLFTMKDESIPVIRVVLDFGQNRDGLQCQCVSVQKMEKSDEFKDISMEDAIARIKLNIFKTQQNWVRPCEGYKPEACLSRLQRNHDNPTEIRLDINLDDSTVLGMTLYVISE